VKAGDLYQKVVLYTVVVLQVTLVPIVGFSLTYLLDVDEQNFTIAVRTELIYWIVVAGLIYGIVSLLLAMVFGGYRPLKVVNRGGWGAVLGLNRRKGDPELIDRARMSLQGSPYGKVAGLVNRKISVDGFDLISVHGGLQLLAVPMQVILIATPLLIMEGVPEHVVKSERSFELGMAGYMIALWMAVRIQPAISNWLVGYAAMFRSVLWKISRFSWVLPILLFWFIARTFLAASLNWLDVDIDQWNEVQLEAIVLNVIFPDAAVPETAVIDFLVAISVLPMATFTTLSVLGGSNDMPDWMKGQDSLLENLQMDLIEAPGTNSEEELDFDFESSEPDEQLKQEDNPEEGSRMIDLPYLFDD
tara:strand:+ start:14221 stop:15300 length:1080 start_codon:yes stop_codon:yes gene_type:complete